MKRDVIEQYKDNPGDAGTLLTDINTYAAAAKTELETSVAQLLKDIKDSLEAVSTIGVCKQKCVLLAEATKQLNCSQVKDFNGLKGKTKKHLAFKKRMSGVKQQDAIEDEGPANPLHAVVSALQATEGDLSVFEAKGGVRACHTFPKADAYDVCEELSRNNVVKKVVKTCKASQKQTGRSWTHSAVSHHDPKSKVLHKDTQKGLDPQFLNKHLLPDEPWAHKVYELDVVLTSKSHTNIAATHYGSIEGRLYLEGHDTVVGLPIDKVEAERGQTSARPC